MSHKRHIVALAALFVAATSFAVPTAPNIGGETPSPPLRGEQIWYDNVDAARMLAAAESKPFLVLFTSPDCPWCARLKAGIAGDKETADLLANWVTAEIDVTLYPRTAMNYQVSSVPALRILSSDGAVRNGVDGYLTSTDLRGLLKESMNPAFVRKLSRSSLDILTLIDGGKIPPERWPDIMLEMGSEENRQDIHDRIFRLQPFPRRELIELLKDPRIAVRLGALELLEEVSGDSFGFDPWDGPLPEPTADASSSRWTAWAGTSTNTPASLYAPLTGDQTASYLRDLVSEDHQRSERARRMLAAAGPAFARPLKDFLDGNPGISPASRRKIREVRYAILIPASGGIDPVSLAHALVFGSLDMRIRSLAVLGSSGKKALPVIRDFLEDSDSMVREAAVDAMAKAGRRSAIPHYEALLGRETDEEVVHAVIRCLGEIRSKKGLAILMGRLANPKEEQVIAALGSIAKLKSKISHDAVSKALDDARWRVRVAALEAVARLDIKTAAPRVEQLLGDSDEFVRHSAVQTLAALSEKTSFDRLAAVFLKEDGMKAVVLAAIVSMEKPVPRSFGPALAGRSPEIALPVLEAMEDCEERDLWLVEPYMADANLDLACTAARLMADKGMSVGRHRKQILEILRTGRMPQRLAVLESIDFPSELLAANRNDVLQWQKGHDSATNTPSAASPAQADFLSAILDDFSAGDEEDGSGRTGDNAAPGAVREESSETGAPPAQAASPAIDDILDAFMEPSGKASSATAPGEPQSSGESASLVEVIREIERLLDTPGEPDVSFQAALVLARVGNPKAVPCLMSTLPSRASEDRAEAASALEEFKTAGAIVPLVRILLQDPSETVRSAAASACMEKSLAAVTVGVLFEELLRKDTRLRPYDCRLYGFKSLAESSGLRKDLRARLQSILTGDHPDDLRAFALILLADCWNRNDTSAVEPFVGSPNPFVRRAALRLLSRHDKDAFRMYMEKLAADPSEHVRMVLPFACLTTHGTWLNFIDAEHFDDEYVSASYKKAALDETAERLLRVLAEDPVPHIRAEAMLALISQFKSVDLARLTDALDSLPDRENVTDRLRNFVTSNYRRLGPGFRILVPYIEKPGDDEEEELAELRRHFAIEKESEDEIEGPVAAAVGRPSVPATFLEAPPPPPPAPQVQRMAMTYFTSPGCQDCARVERLLDDVRGIYPSVEITVHNVRKVPAMRLNEALCERFQVPDSLRLVAPAVFAAGGALHKGDITFASLSELISRSAVVPRENWEAVTGTELAEAETAISRRYSAIGIGVVLLAGLLDGVNPCAFATVIFFVSYLRISGRRPRENLGVGLAFIAGVFVAYFVLGLGLIEIVARLGVLRRAGRALNWLIAAVALIVAALSVRDGILCMRGRMSDMTIQLPAFLKAGIRTSVRMGARAAHFAAAAFVVGIVISFLELACTGQVYAPTILYMLKTGQDRAGALVYLLVYNIAFVIPLLAVFATAFLGATNTALNRVMVRHAAAVKFATAALFVLLFLLFVLGEQLSTLRL